jgi:hypothetical protein
MNTSNHYSLTSEDLIPRTPSLVMNNFSQNPSPEFTPFSSTPATPVDEAGSNSQQWPMPEQMDLEDLRNLSLVNANLQSSISTAVYDDSKFAVNYDLSNAADRSLLPRTRPRANTGSRTKLTKRWPSLSKGWNHRKTSSLSTANSMESIETSYSSRLSSTSRRPEDEFFAHPSYDTKEFLSGLEMSPPTSPFQSVLFTDEEQEPFDRKKLAPTPLLPPMLDEMSKTPPPPPTKTQVSPRPFGLGLHASALSPSPVIHSSKPSISSSIRSNYSSTQSESLSSSLALLSPPPDKWSEQLGHANFTIHPEPYLPAALSHMACEKLVSDYAAASAEFVKQQARALEHYGPNSRIYQLTQDKWTEIDGQWRSNMDEVVVQATQMGVDLGNLILEQQQQQGLNHQTSHSRGESGLPMMMSLPPFNPHIDGKFPTLGDGSIVGPMETVASSNSSSPTQRSPTGRFFRIGSLFGSNKGTE